MRILLCITICVLVWYIPTLADDMDSLKLQLPKSQSQFQNSENTQNGYEHASSQEARSQPELRKETANWFGFGSCPICNSDYCSPMFLVTLFSLLGFGYMWYLRFKKSKLTAQIKSDNNYLRTKNIQLKSEKLEMKSINASLNAELNALNDKLKEPEILKEGTITLSNRNKTVLKFGDIIYIKACQNGVQIVTTTEKFIYWKGIGKFVKDLPPLLFVQTHRSYIVNKAHVKSIQSDQIKMSNEEMVRVGGDYKAKTAFKIKGDN